MNPKREKRLQFIFIICKRNFLVKTNQSQKNWNVETHFGRKD